MVLCSILKDNYAYFCINQNPEIHVMLLRWLDQDFSISCEGFDYVCIMIAFIFDSVQSMVSIVESKRIIIFSE